MKFHMPIEGPFNDISKTPDEMFSQKTMGPGFVIHPIIGRVYAPVDGIIKVMFPTGHAVGIMDNRGNEYLIHVGLETVDLKGEGFKIHVQQGDRVKAGDLLVEFDVELIKEKAESILSPVVFLSKKMVEIKKQKEIDRRALLTLKVK